ncbi:MAG TPA: gluconokinase [Chthoniobacterales bacterium]
MKVLAIDIGTSSVRSALFDSRARSVRASKTARSYRLRHEVDHAAELDPALLLRATKDCLRETRRCLTKRQSLAIAASGFWHSLLGLDRTGNPLTPIYTWADARCVDDAFFLRQRMNERAIQQRTGCMLRASFWPAKLIWLQRTRPRLFRRAARWVSPPEWIFEQLFGVRSCSHSMASGTGLYHLGRHDWDEEMLDMVGLTPSQLNPLQDCVAHPDGTIFTPIGDGAAGNLGSGASRPGVIAINVGTSAAVRVVTPPGTPLPFGLFRFAIDEQRSLLGGAISNAGSLRAWCLRELCLPNERREIEKLLRQKWKETSRLTILPFLVSERAPTWPDDLSGTIIGLSQATTAADLLAAMVAASFHRLAEILRELETAAGRANRIIVSGGVVQSMASLQVLSDSLGRKLEVCAEQEASLRGAAVHALEQLGLEVPAPKIKRRLHNRPVQTAQKRKEAARQRELEQLLGNQLLKRGH